MSELLERLKAIAPDETLDWLKVREEIHDEHGRATTTAERVTFLEIFEDLMVQLNEAASSKSWRCSGRHDGKTTHY